MKFTKFDIKNFKGIEHTKIDLDKNPKGNVYSLVGLNESGKTTILEAISYLISNDEDYRSLCDKASYSSLDNPYELVPPSKRAFFNESISIQATISSNEKDIKEISTYAQTLGVKLDEAQLAKPFTVTKKTTFEASTHKTTTYWGVNLYAKKPKEKTFKELGARDDIWQKLIIFIKKLLPNIFYFPTFLFDFPQKIYLEETSLRDSQKTKINSYYKNILQDILESMYPNQTLDSLILQRLKSGIDDQKRQAESVLLSMSQKISKEVFELWNKIFNITSSSKTIDIKYKEEAITSTPSSNTFYLEFEIKDGVNMYNITQRSLGFRWFFCFLLFTHIRANQKNTTLFLFDEPASNLHSSAQQQLLSCFSKIASNDSQIIYSTHSQYMINPNWLENTYVVENKGLKNDIEDINDYHAVNTNIKAILYKTFVNEHPEKTSYFQPILDLLEYQPCYLDNIPNVAIFEGKTDHYFINYFAKLTQKDKKLHIMPGLGSGHLDALIALYLGWGRKFIVILDGDKEGIKSKKTYQEDFLLSDDIIFTLNEIDSSWTKIESLISNNDRKAFNNGKSANKKQLDRLFQELLAKEDFSSTFEDETKNNMMKLIDFIKSKV